MIKTDILVLLTLSLFTLFQTHAQIEKDQIPLTSFLNTIEQKLGYNFSYIDQDVKDITIPSSTIEDLETIISYLEKNTPFQYTILPDNTITINSKSIELCGIVTDIHHTPIKDASVQIHDTVLISNQQGMFTYPTHSIEKAMITITYLGYQTKKITIKELIETPCKKIILIPKIELLNQIVLNDYLTKGIDKQSDGSIRINYNNFGILPGLIEPDLLQTIQALPGILSVNETVSDINVRGGTNDQNLILWDGIKMYQSSHFFGLISAFNPYLTKNIQLYKNGSSSVYGDGVSSVISMHTSDSLTKALDASIGLNLISIDGYVDTPIGNKSSLQIAVRQSINNLIETPTYNQYFDKAFQDSEVINGGNSDDQFSFYDASIRWLYQLSPKDLLKINTITMHNNLVFQENTSINQVDISKESSAKQKNIAGGILYQRDWHTNFRSTLLLYGTNYNLQAINSDIENNQRLLQENDILENGIKLHTTLNATTTISLKNGYQFNETGISNLQDINNPTFRDRTKEVIRTHSLFSEFEYKSRTGNTNINAGLRLNYHEKFDAYNVEPRMSVVKKIADHFTLEILGELKSQTTSQIIDLQNDFLGIENRRWILSNNEDIPIIKSKQGSIGLSYTHHNWLISSEMYYKEVTGIITKSQGFQNQYELVNEHGSYTVKGIDFLINKRFKNFNTWLSYTYADNEYTFENLADRNFPNTIDIRHHINFALAYNLKKFKFSGGINWHSGKPSTDPDPINSITDTTINYLAPNNARIKEYTRVDISTTYNFNISKTIKAVAGLSIWNLTDQQNISNDYYEAVNSTTIKKIEENGLGFTPNIVFRLNF